MDQLLASSKLLMSAKLIKEEEQHRQKALDAQSALSKVTFEAKRLPSITSKPKEPSASNSVHAVTPQAKDRDKNALFILKALFKQQSQRNADDMHQG